MHPTALTPRQALAELKDQLPDRIVEAGDEIDRLAHDSSRYAPQGQPLAAVLATSTQDVATALAWANRHGVPVSVRGAGTGLAGGAVAYDQGLIISMERCNRIRDLDPVNRLAVVEAGVIPAELDQAAREHGLFFPPDPASVEISTVGGNIATNAGGLRCIAHGVTRDAVAALEVVLADGTILHTGTRTRKNVVGLDLTSLFVGSEGTLGVITAATVRLKPVPLGTPHTFRANFDAIDAAGEAVTDIVNGPAQPEVLELLDAHSVKTIEAFHPSGLTVPKAAVLIGQTVGPDAAAKAEAITQICAAHGATDVVIAQSDSLLEARRLANPALSASGLRVSCDVGVPIGQLANVFEASMRSRPNTGVPFPSSLMPGMAICIRPLKPAILLKNTLRPKRSLLIFHGWPFPWAEPSAANTVLVRLNITSYQSSSTKQPSLPSAPSNRHWIPMRSSPRRAPFRRAQPRVASTRRGDT